MEEDLAKFSCFLKKAVEVQSLRKKTILSDLCVEYWEVTLGSMLLSEKDKLNADSITRGTSTKPTGCNDRDALVNQIKVQS